MWRLLLAPSISAEAQEVFTESGETGCTISLPATGRPYPLRTRNELSIQSREFIAAR